MKMKKFALSLVAVAACAGAFRAYEGYQQSGETDALLAENVLALSAGDGSNDDPCIIKHYELKEETCWSEYYDEIRTYYSYDGATYTTKFKVYTDGRTVCVSGNDKVTKGGYSCVTQKSGVKKEKSGVYRWCQSKCFHFVDAWNDDCPIRCDRRDQITCSSFNPGCSSTLGKPNF